MVVGVAVRAARKKKGLTQAQLAERSGVTAVQICRIELGIRNPSYASLRALAVALDMDLNVLKHDQDTAPSPEEPA